jgi:hypothetical protein
VPDDLPKIASLAKESGRQVTNEAVLHGTQRYVLRSEAVGDDYEITVLAPPPEMGVGRTPVVIGTDANMLIGLYTDVVGQLMVGG